MPCCLGVASAAENPPKPHGTVLIVDDDPQIGAIVRVVLRRAGYECLIAQDGDTAWKLLSPQVALVLLDVMMPGQNGPEILWRMRRDPALAHIPVIFVTGRSDASTRIQCIAMGAADFIVKPFKPKELIEKIQLAASRSGSRDIVDDGAAEEGADPLDEALEVELGGHGEAEPATREASALVNTPLVKGLLAERRATRQALDAHSRLFSALFRLHQSMGAEVDLAGLAEVIVALAQKALLASGATLWLPAARVLRALATRGMEQSDGVDLESDAPPAQAWREWLTVERSSGESAQLELHQPLTAGTERIGVLSLLFPIGHAPSESLTSFFSAEVALAVESALRFDRARSEAVTDALTGAYNRRFMEKRLADELSRARTLAAPLSLMFVDIDHFKTFNDRFGHDVGDRVLRETAELLRTVLRKVDVVARFGGDEFVAVLPDTDRQGSRVVARVIREGVARLASESGPELSSLTVTIGAASFPEDGSSAAEILAVADAAMLRGKRAGRDRIELFGTGESGERTVGEAADAPRVTAVVLRALLHALDLRDPGTGSHSRAVAALSARIARQMGCSADEIRLTAQAGLLHDIGKLHTPDRVLLKPGPLDLEERAVMDRHADLGADLTDLLPELRHLTPIVRACQEHWDGGGYPLGIGGEQIPLAARVIAVADAFHAMISDRPYRRAMPISAAAAELRRCAGTQFEPYAVAALLAVVGVTLRKDVASDTARIASAA